MSTRRTVIPPRKGVKLFNNKLEFGANLLLEVVVMRGDQILGGRNEKRGRGGRTHANGASELATITGTVKEAAEATGAKGGREVEGGGNEEDEEEPPEQQPAPKRSRIENREEEEGGDVVREDLDKIKPNLIKSVLELPTSTPSIAIQYEFGIIDLSIDVLMEKVIVAVETLNRDENRISKKLLEALMKKNVDGFCTELSQACSILNVELDKVLNAVNVRKYLKRAVTKLQSHILLRKMMLSSKTDMALLAGFSFHGYF